MTAFNAESQSKYYNNHLQNGIVSFWKRYRFFCNFAPDKMTSLFQHNIPLMKRFLLLILLLSQIGYSFPQAGEAVSAIERNRSEYYFGHGYGSSYDEALGAAKANVAADISSFVSSRTEASISTETGVSMTQIINTFSKTTELRDVSVITVSEGPKWHVFCYLPRSVIRQMDKNRKNKAMDYIQEAEGFEKNMKIADALQFYYWGLVMLKTSFSDSILYREKSGEERRRWSLWLDEHIDEMLQNLRFSVAKVTEQDGWYQIELAVTYRGMPVQNCEYRYWTGQNKSELVRVRDGRGVAEFSQLPTKLQISIEYAFKHEARNIDYELDEIMENLPLPTYKSSNVEIVLPDELPYGASGIAANTANEEKMIRDLEACGMVVGVQQDSCEKRVQTLCECIRRKDMKQAEGMFTPEGFELFRKMMANGNVSLIGNTSCNFVRYGNTVLGRGLPVRFKFKDGRTFVENVEFRFNSDYKIESVAFMINDGAEADILRHSNWSAASRMRIIQFLEDYQTAYALKRLDYIEQIFSDDALIIVGTKLKPARVENQIKLSNGERFQLVQKSKETYLRDLARSFSKTDYINLQLKDNEVRRSGKNEMYGIQIKQLYTSNLYADKGYLFLVVDLRDESNPILHVRVWQEEKDPDFGLINLSDFMIPNSNSQGR